MNAANDSPLIAVDIGNSRIKFGLFDADVKLPERELPTPSATLDLKTGAETWERIPELLAGRSAAAARWVVGSVQRQTTSHLVEALRHLGAQDITLLTSGDLPLAIDLPQPDRVGIDRLLGAVAANRLRAPDKPAVVVHVGTAITVNLVAADGRFCGGAIMPGIVMSARAMHEFTDLLPLIDMPSLTEAPPPLGTATVAAMTSGLYWGAVGGVKQLVELYGKQVGSEPEVFLTGGAAPSIVKNFAGTVRFVPQLVLGGIALTAART